VAAKRDLARSYVLTDASPAIVQQLGAGAADDFVFIAVELAAIGTLM
jgi:hypothetical protein